MPTCDAESGPKKKKRTPKPPPEPRFALGQVVRTRAAVKVPNPGGKVRNRKFLHLLPGTEWKVIAVERPAAGVRQAIRYQLQTVSCGIVAARKEFQLRTA